MVPDLTLFPPASCPRLIVKIGSALLVDDDGGVRRAWLEGIAADIAARTKAGQQIAVVSSGAIALGARRLGLAKGGRASLEDAQAAAATGQIALSHVWAEVLGAHGLTQHYRRDQKVMEYGMTVHSLDRHAFSQLSDALRARDDVVEFRISPTGD